MSYFQLQKKATLLIPTEIYKEFWITVALLLFPV